MNRDVEGKKTKPLKKKKKREKKIGSGFSGDVP